jgi:hypothetical protein
MSAELETWATEIRAVLVALTDLLTYEFSEYIPRPIYDDLIRAYGRLAIMENWMNGVHTAG